MAGILKVLFSSNRSLGLGLIHGVLVRHLAQNHLVSVGLGMAYLHELLFYWRDDLPSALLDDGLVLVHHHLRVLVVKTVGFVEGFFGSHSF